jgi:hypothetical protein
MTSIAMTSIAMTAAISELYNTRESANRALHKLETKIALRREAVFLLNVANKAIRHQDERMATLELDDYCESTTGDQLLFELDAIGWHAYHNVDRANIMVFVAHKEFDEAKLKAVSATAFVNSVMADEAKAESEYNKSINDANKHDSIYLF